MISEFLTSGTHCLEGPCGIIELLVDVPKTSGVVGWALIAHPQPLLGGSAQHKVPHFLARSLVERGWIAVRPNFRGVGRSTGNHDLGEGEAEDLRWLVDEARRGQLGEVPFALVGVSFGAFVQAKVAKKLQIEDLPAQYVCLAATPCGEVEGGRHYYTPQGISNALVIHGEQDERVPLQSIFDWARPSSQVVSVIPGADHLFTGKLPVLRSLILDFLHL